MATAAVAVIMRQASQRADEQRRDADRSHRHARHFGELSHADRAQIARHRGDGLPDAESLVRRQLAIEQRRAAGGGVPGERAFAAADDDDLLALVDELFVEFHFYAPSLRWVHLTHSMKQAFDVLRQLRACGLPVHAWP